jgi:hypothetical protein
MGPPKGCPRVDQSIPAQTKWLKGCGVPDLRSCKSARIAGARAGGHLEECSRGSEGVDLRISDHLMSKEQQP